MNTLAIFLVSLLIGTLYALTLALFSKNLDAPLILWPVLIWIFWFLFRKFNLLRFTAYFLVLPLSLFSFEYIWSLQNPGMNAEVYKALDRSHYTPGLEVTRAPAGLEAIEGGIAKPKDILIGQDGFRADPVSGRGNPERCQYVLVGDSMIYGTGLPYPLTLGPALESMGRTSCILGVTGNSPVDYLSTLRYAADRIDRGAFIAVYVYAYNDFISLSKYSRRRFLSGSNWVRPLFLWGFYFDQWRQSSWIYAWTHSSHDEQTQSLKPWPLKIGNAQPIEVLYERDPSQYAEPESLNNKRRLALNMFFDDVAELATERNWRIAILFHPADAEIYANFAHQSRNFTDLDPRRAEGMEICRQYPFTCEDISSYIFERSYAAGLNPYFRDDLHFSPFGVRIVAEHLIDLTKKYADSGMANSQMSP